MRVRVVVEFTISGPTEVIGLETAKRAAELAKAAVDDLAVDLGLSEVKIVVDAKACGADVIVGFATPTKIC